MTAFIYFIAGVIVGAAIIIAAVWWLTRPETPQHGVAVGGVSFGHLNRHS
jgi:hypothetical protein